MLSETSRIAVWREIRHVNVHEEYPQEERFVALPLAQPVEYLVVVGVPRHVGEGAFVGPAAENVAARRNGEVPSWTQPESSDGSPDTCCSRRCRRTARTRRIRGRTPSGR